MSPVATRMGTQLALLLGPELHSLQQHCGYPRGRWELQPYTCHRSPPTSVLQHRVNMLGSIPMENRGKKKKNKAKISAFICV